MNKYLYRLKNEEKQKALVEAFKFFKLDFDKELQKACEYEFGLCPEDGDKPMDITIYFDKSTLRLPRKEIKKISLPRLKNENLHKLLCEYDPDFPVQLHKALQKKSTQDMGMFSVPVGLNGRYFFSGHCDACVVDEEEPDATE